MFEKESKKIIDKFIEDYKIESYNKYNDIVNSNNLLFNRLLAVSGFDKIPNAEGVLLVIFSEISLIMARKEKTQIVAILLLQRWNSQINVNNKLATEEDLYKIIDNISNELDKL